MADEIDITPIGLSTPEGVARVSTAQREWDSVTHQLANTLKEILDGGKLLGVMKSDPQDFAHVYIMGLEVEPSGAWSSFELDAYRATQLRRKDSHRRIKWSDLPTEVKKSVQRWAEED